MIALREYQIDCVAAVKESLLSFSKVLVVMATGLGKTTVAAELIKQSPGASLFIAHRRELIAQAYSRLVEYTGRPVGIEMGSRKSKGEDIVVGSIQSLLKREIAYPDLIIIDEAHHAVSNTYLSVLDRFPDAKVVGVTATPDRADQKPLGDVFRHVAYRYETLQAIEDGWLAPIFKRQVSGVSGLMLAVGSRKTVVFTPTVAEAIEVAGMLPSATYVHGELSGTERDLRISDFKAGKYQYITNCNVLTEGFDMPEIGCVAMMRALQSRGMFVQMIGRGLRLAPGKTDCLYLDLVDMPKHSLEGPSDPLAGKVTAPSFLPKNSFWRQFFA